MKTLEQEVTCPLCLDIFKQPKKLPCDHVYCKACLLGLVQRRTSRDSGTFTCPECRKPAEASSPADLESFPTPYHVNRLIEMYQKGLEEAKKDSGGGAVGATPGSRDVVDGPPADEPRCELHRTQSLSFYCQTCKKLVCRDCILFGCAKGSHEYGYVKDKLEEEKLSLESKLYPVKQLHVRMITELRSADTFDSDLSNEEERLMQELEVSFQKLAGVLEEEKETLQRDIRSKFDDAREQNSTRRQEVQKVCTRLEAVLQTIHHHDSLAGFLAGTEARGRAIAKALQQDVGSPPSAAKPPCLGVSVLSADKLRQACQDGMYCYQKDDPLRCHFERVNWDHVPLEGTTTLVLHLESAAAESRKGLLPPKLEARLWCLSARDTHQVEVTQFNPRLFRLLLKPRLRGQHELHVKYDGSHISGSPFRLYVEARVAKLCPTTQAQLQQPMGIKCGGGRVYVSELGLGLTVLEPRTLKKLSGIWMPDIWEVLVDKEGGKIYGTDNKRQAVRMMNMSGDVLRTIGGVGTEQFRWPNGIRCSKRGEIVVCDTMNNKLQVFDKQLNLLKVIEHSSFNVPDDLDFDQEGNFYVANQGSHTVCVFSPEGTFLRAIGSKGSRPGELDNPVSVAVHRDLLYVTDCANSRISIFTIRGSFVGTFGEGVLRKPECVAVDEDGYVYVTDMREKLYIF